MKNDPCKNDDIFDFGQISHQFHDYFTYTSLPSYRAASVFISASFGQRNSRKSKFFVVFMKNASFSVKDVFFDWHFSRKSARAPATFFPPIEFLSSEEGRN